MGEAIGAGAEAAVAAGDTGTMRRAWGGPADTYAPSAGPFAPTMTAEQELGDLKKQAEYFQDELGQINKRIEQLETESNK